MRLVTIPAVNKLNGLKLSEPLIAQQGLYFRASAEAQPDWPQVWLIQKFEGKEGAAFSLVGNERHHPLDPFRLPWKLEGVAVLKLLQLLIRSHERSNDLTSRRQVFPREQAGQCDGFCFLLSIRHKKHLFLFFSMSTLS
jgi:hypothetical protein